VQNKCALYWAEGEDGNTAEYSIYEGSISVMMSDRSTNPSSGYIKRVFEVVKQQVTSAAQRAFHKYSP